MKILNRPDNLIAYILIIMLNVLFSCNTKHETKEEFLKKFQFDLEERRVENIAAYTHFPLINGEYLTDQEVNQSNFGESFNTIFDSLTVESITNINLNQFQEIRSS